MPVRWMLTRYAADGSLYPDSGGIAIWRNDIRLLYRLHTQVEYFNGAYMMRRV